MTESSLQVVYTDPGGQGYHCVLHMARLAADLLGGELVVVPPQHIKMIDKVGGILFPRKGSNTTCLLISPSPADLSSILLLHSWRKPFKRIVAWVFDSFWIQLIPPWARNTRLFDHIFVTEQEDLADWRKLMHAPVDWLPWGSDVLNLGSSSHVRPFDLLRFGRQPEEWDDDLINQQSCEARGLDFHGRPKSWSDATDHERGLMQTLSGTKFSLAFTNRVSSGKNTHPRREYLTGRWTDSLASGASVAGIPPASETVQSLLWPEALVDIGSIHREQGLEVLTSMVHKWSPEQARINYLRSLEKLDWRSRFKTLSQALQVQSPRLDAELERLDEAIRSTQGPGVSLDRTSRSEGPSVRS